MTSGSGVRERKSPAKCRRLGSGTAAGGPGSNCTCCVSSIVVSEGGDRGSCLFVLLFGLFVSFVPSTEFASFPDTGLMEELYGFFLKRQD